MKPFLLGQGVYSFVDGTSSCPPSHLAATETSTFSVNPAYLSWKQQNHLSSLSVEVLHLVIDCNTSHAIWTTLETAFASPSNSRIMQLHGSFQDLRHNDDSASIYLQKAKALFDELAAAGRPISLAEFNLYVFRGLRSEFKDLVTSLSTKDAPITYTDLHSSLLTHEFLHKASLQPSVTAPLLPTPTQQPAAFFVQHQSGRRGHFRGSWRPNNRSNFYHGNGPAHSYTSGQQYSPHGNRFSSGTSSRPTCSFGQQGNRFSGYTRNIKCQLCYEYGHTAQ